jgi:hypothetical protein
MDPAPHDSITFLGVGVGLAAIGIDACWLPALLAAQIDPAITIRLKSAIPTLERPHELD